MSTRARLLSALEGPAGTCFSGEKLAAQLGISRAMVWKHVRSLQEIGIPIRSDRRAGYRLTGPIDSSLLEWQGGRLWGGRLVAHHFFLTASTQRLARQAAEGGMPEGHFWLAERQTSGRGRLERAWDSAYGGLWCSILLRPRVPSAQAPTLTQVVALALAETLRGITRLDVRLKWPNDLGILTVQGWRKVAGILTEMAGEPDQVRWMVVGIGLNANNSIPDELKGIGASLLELTGQTVARAQVLNRFWARFGPLYQQWLTQGFRPFRRPFWRLHRSRPAALTLRTAQGLVSGAACGVDDSGRLIIKSRRQTVRLLEGEIIS